LDAGAVKGTINDTSLTEIAMDDHEGLAETSAFLYDPATKVLALQRNRYGISTGMCAQYFTEKAEVNPIQLEPCIKEEAIRRLADFRIYRRFRFKLAGPTDPKLFSGDGLTSEQILYLMKTFKATNVEISMSMGRDPGGLSGNKIVQAARSFWQSMQQGEGTVWKAQIEGLTAAARLAERSDL
jgi:hypothetical protein